MPYLLVGLGFAGLMIGAELLLRGGVGLARRLGISALVVGIVVVGFATSLPELVVSVTAALEGSPDIAVGNVVGSNIANVLLILGAVAVITPIIARREQIRFESGVVLAATIALIGLGLFGVINAVAGFALVMALVAFLYLTYRRERSSDHPDHAAEADDLEMVPASLGMALLVTAGGLILVVIGSEALVTGAIEIARIHGVSEAVIGLTLIAIGTSLPELACGVVAALRRHVEMALGNVLGSNVFNILGIAGITALVAPIPVADKIVAFDLWVMLAATLICLGVVQYGQRIGRVAAVAFLIGYGGYIAIQFDPADRVTAEQAGPVMDAAAAR